jgi:hypothetical protein
MGIDASQPSDGSSAHAPLYADVDASLTGDGRSTHSPIMVDDLEMALEVDIKVLMVDDQNIEHSIPVTIPLDAGHRDYIPIMPHGVDWAGTICDWDMNNYLADWECFDYCSPPYCQFHLFQESYVTTP